MWDENKVRIKDVAEALGVSTATVSNVLHGKTKKISDATVKRVQEKLNEMGYVPNMAATLLAQNNSRIIGVVVNDHPKYEGHVLEDPYVCSALNALSNEIDNAGYFMMLRKSSQISEIPVFASMWNMDGMIIMGFCQDDYQSLRDKIRIPFVVYDGFFVNDRNICNLMLDDYDGGRQVGEYIRNHGKKHVLCIADNKLSPDYDRYKGLCHGLQLTADYLIIPMSREERISFYKKRILKFNKYDVIFSVSDYYGIELMNLLIQNGYSIPKDLWMIGFDDISLCKSVIPPFASVRQDVELRAKKAIEYIHAMKEDSQFSATERIPVKLIVRESCKELVID